jgi:hypothetical protein
MVGFFWYKCLQVVHVQNSRGVWTSFCFLFLLYHQKLHQTVKWGLTGLVGCAEARCFGAFSDVAAQAHLLLLCWLHQE